MSDLKEIISAMQNNPANVRFADLCYKKRLENEAASK